MESQPERRVVVAPGENTLTIIPPSSIPTVTLEKSKNPHSPGLPEVRAKGTTGKLNSSKGDGLQWKRQYNVYQWAQQLPVEQIKGFKPMHVHGVLQDLLETIISEPKWWWWTDLEPDTGEVWLYRASPLSNVSC